MLRARRFAPRVVTLPSAAHSGQVQLRGRASTGEPVPGQRMVLRAAQREEAPWAGVAAAPGRPFVRFAGTDDAGRAVFADVPPGTYTADLTGTGGDGFISPARNPLAAPPL